MSGGTHERMEKLLPWYANGTLEDDERQEVAAHLETCASCRALLVPADATRVTADEVEPDRLLEHVSARLMAEWVEEPGSLEPETRSWLASHVAGCADCSALESVLARVNADLAAAEADETPRAAGAGRPGVPARDVPGLLARLWEALRGSVLHPVPALAYLLLVVALLPLWRGGDGGTSPGAGPAVLPPAVRVDGDPAVRAEAHLALEPLEVPAPPGPDGRLHLDLRTDIDEEDLEDPQAAFVVEIADGESVVWSSTQPGTAFDSLARLGLLLPASELPPDRLLELRVRLRRSGDPLDGTVLFRRGLRVTAP